MNLDTGPHEKHACGIRHKGNGILGRSQRGRSEARIRYLLKPKKASRSRTLKAKAPEEKMIESDDDLPFPLKDAGGGVQQHVVY